LNQLAAHVARRSVAGRGIEKLARIVLGVGDELPHRFERHRGRDREQQVPACCERNRLQVTLDVVRNLRHHVARDGERADRPHADRVAVGVGLGGEVEADRQGAARAVVDHDLLAELFAELRAENARDGIGRAAGSLRDDEPDRPIRVLRRRAGRNHASEQGQSESDKTHVATPNTSPRRYGIAFRRL
jgi:hypothetical protein